MSRDGAGSEWLAEFGAAIKAGRSDLGWTQRDLAVRVGLSRVSIANIEAGRQDVPSTTATQIVTLLGIDVPGWDLREDPHKEQLIAALAEVDRLRRVIRGARTALAESEVDDRVTTAD